MLYRGDEGSGMEQVGRWVVDGAEMGEGDRKEEGKRKEADEEVGRGRKRLEGHSGSRRRGKV
jgi:hypothetical protein